jgi:hypothetical protein
VRHHTLLCCVTASGDSYCPMLITPTASARKFLIPVWETTSISL